MNYVILYLFINFWITITVVDAVNFDDDYRAFLNKRYGNWSHYIWIYWMILLILFWLIFMIWSLFINIYRYVKNT